MKHDNKDIALRPDDMSQWRKQTGRNPFRVRVDWVARHAEVDASVGRRFGELVVTSRDPRPSDERKLRVFVRCDCGAERSVAYSSLVSGNNTTCGTSQHRDRERLERGAEIVGNRYGTLVVKSALAEGRIGGPASRGARTQVVVTCDCGAERRADVSDLITGSIRSCGGPAHQAIAPQIPKRWQWQGSPKTYAVEAIGTGMIKIGSARDVDERMRDLQTGCPVPLRVLAISDDNIERRMHAELEADRAHGEWFNATIRVRAAIATHMKPAAFDVTIRSPRDARGKYRCKTCGELGHFSKTCTALTPPATESV